MSELEKIVRVLRKVEPTAPHAVLLVLDATVGQNALSQVEMFQKTAGVTGLVMTKLDGSARGGILVALATKFGLPVHFIGVGEGIEDSAPFTAQANFARAIVRLELTNQRRGWDKPGHEAVKGPAWPRRHQNPIPFLKLALDIRPLFLFFAANGRFGIYAATVAFRDGAVGVVVILWR